MQQDPLPTVFTCLFCNHENAVSVKLNKKEGVGQLDCKICGQKFQCSINCRSCARLSASTPHPLTSLPDLSAAVDVFSEWVDAADAVAQGNNASNKAISSSKMSSAQATASGRRADEDEEDDRRYTGDGIAEDDEYD